MAAIWPLRWRVEARSVSSVPFWVVEEREDQSGLQGTRLFSIGQGGQHGSTDCLRSSVADPHLVFHILRTAAYMSRWCDLDVRCAHFPENMHQMRFLVEGAPRSKFGLAQNCRNRWGLTSAVVIWNIVLAPIKHCQNLRSDVEGIFDRSCGQYRHADSDSVTCSRIWTNE